MTSTRRVLGRIADLTGSIALAAGTLVLAFAGVAGFPALGSAFNPDTGVWRLSADDTGVRPGATRVAGLHEAVTVGFEKNGLTHVTASTDDDLWTGIGYVHARLRTFQLDLMRRQGEGTLSEILGPSQLESDRFELDLGLRRSAERDWAAMPGGPERSTLTAYAAGVNAGFEELVRDHELPVGFKLAGYTPAPWTPVDSLVVQRELSQNLSFSEQALVYGQARDALGAQAFEGFFPRVPANQQYPYDPGPYVREPLSPLPVRADPATEPDADLTATALTARPGTGDQEELRALVDRTAMLRPGETNEFGASNAWAVSGSRTADHAALLASDPHLDFSLPSIWFQVEGTSPGYHFDGPTIPGVPVPLMGRTDQISWGITNSQRPTTLFYREETDAAHPGAYRHDGRWEPVQRITYRIPVMGQAPETHTVQLTAHGPIMQINGQTVSVWWAGTLPSDNIGDVLTMLRTTTFTAFRDATRTWATPAVNFVYADRGGHIGAFTAGAAPQTAGADPALPLPGDGRADVTGSIPFGALPHVADPPSGYVVSSNQREVTAAYPYQYSTSYNFADQGWRATTISRTLATAHDLTAADFERLQTSHQDPLGVELAAAVTKALGKEPLSDQEKEVLATLSSWDGDMSLDSVAATVFTTLENRTASLALRPRWNTTRVPAGDHEALPSPYGETSATPIVAGTVLKWAATDPDNPLLGPGHTAGQLLARAFHDSVAQLTREYGKDLSAWAYGKHHWVVFQSLIGSKPLDAGPYPSGGDEQTVNAAVGGLHDGDTVRDDISTGGASWRFVIDWGTGTASAIYPGGQSESPLSPWYDNGLAPWQQGTLWPLRYGLAAGDPSITTTWRLSR